MSDAISIIYFGTPAYACPALKVLAADSRFKILAVVTQPDRPSGRGKKLTPPPVRVLADEFKIPCFQTNSIKKDADLQEKLKAFAPDFFVTVAFGQILTQAVLDIPSRGTVNAHASLLPLLRGANPIQHAILEGHKTTGVATMITELGVDTGPMLKKSEIEIGPLETLGELAARLADINGPLLVETLLELVAGTLKPEAQDDTLATQAPKCPKEMALLNWNESASVLQRKIHAFNPAPGSVSFFNGERVKILRAELSNLSQGNASAGSILEVTNQGLLVACADKPLLVTSLQPAGKKEMPAQDWARGYFKGESKPNATFGMNQASLIH
jgi:methionyl-tRNA formyltransferase